MAKLRKGELIQDAEGNNARQILNLKNPTFEQTPAHIAANAKWGFPVVQRGEGKGKTVAICGAGPSLRETYHRLQVGLYDVWACNSALPWLASNGVPIHRGCAIEMSPIMLQTWKEAPPIPYLLGTCVHPHLVIHLLQQRAPRIHWFHNFVGFAQERDIYKKCYPFTILAGMGLNVVNRLVQVADYMDYDRIEVYGADSALGRDGSWHMNGERSTDKHLLTAEVNEQMWVTPFDMAYSASALVWQKRVLGERMALIGDTFPNAILADARYQRDPKGFLRLLPHFGNEADEFNEFREWEECERIGRVGVGEEDLDPPIIIRYGEA
jgi:hypothetical protein